MRAFDVASIPDACSVFIVGRRGTGKSSLVKQLLAGHAGSGNLVINATEEARPDYADFAASCEVLTEFDAGAVTRLFARQHVKFARRNGMPCDPCVRCVFDNCMIDQTWQRDADVVKVFAACRTLKIKIILTMAYPALAPTLRSSFDFVFLAHDTNPANVKRSYEMFGGAFPTLDAFASAHAQATAHPFEFMVIQPDLVIQQDAVFSYALPTI